MTEQDLAYVRHEDVFAYLDLGWEIATTDLGHHSRHAVLMIWAGEGPYRKPVSDSSDVVTLDDGRTE